MAARTCDLRARDCPAGTLAIREVDEGGSCYCGWRQQRRSKLRVRVQRPVVSLPPSTMRNSARRALDLRGKRWRVGVDKHEVGSKLRAGHTIHSGMCRHHAVGETVVRRRVSQAPSICQIEKFRDKRTHLKAPKRVYVDRSA